MQAPQQIQPTKLADFDATVAALRGEFRVLGDTGAYFFLCVVGEKVPPHEEWMKAHEPAPRGASTRRQTHKI